MSAPPAGAGGPGRDFRPDPVRQAVRRGLELALPRRLFMTSGPTSARAVALTFDDGPHPEHTPAVLDRLHALGVRATFFVVGRAAEAHPELVARIAREGHVLGGHSFHHRAPDETSALALASETCRTARLLSAVAPPGAPRLCRPPYGKLGATKLAALWALGQTVVLWNRDPRDFVCSEPEPIRRWFRDAPLAGGDIVLLHDVHPRAVAALEAAVERVRTAGLGFCTPADWVS